MERTLCFGEPLLRMSPMLQQHWLQHAYMPVFVGGAELNVAQALARWGPPVTYCTALPENYLSTEIIDALAANKVAVRILPSSGRRIGQYFLPQGAGLQHGGVIYDRENSSFSQLKPGTVDWDMVLQGIDRFHFSAITPALNENLARVCAEAVEAASAKKIKISLDLNYRERLWHWCSQPAAVMAGLAAHCDIIMGNIWSANSLLGVPLNEQLIAERSKQGFIDHAAETSQRLMQAYPKCGLVANTFRFDEGKRARYYATLQTEAQMVVSEEYESLEIVDRSGSGDCFMAGLLYGDMQQWPLQDTADFAAAAAVGKLHEKGDATQQSVATVYQTMGKYD